MPEFNLPGMSNDIDVKSIIDKLVKVESKKLDRFEEARDKLEKEKSAWANLGNKIKNLEESAISLYGFRSPFDDKIVKTAEEDKVTGTASRIATPSKYSVKIERMAQNEKIISDPIDNTRIFDGQNIKLIVGENEIEINFRGGRIEELSDLINKQGGEYLTAKLTKIRKNSSVLILEVKKTGEKNRLIIKDKDSLNLFKQLGIFEEKAQIKVDTSISSETIIPIAESNNYEIEENTIILEPKNSVKLPLKNIVKATDNLLLKFKVKGEDIVTEEEEKVEIWPVLKSIGSVRVRDVEIEGEKSISKIEEIKKKQQPIIIDNSVIGVSNIAGLKSTVKIEDLGKELKEYSFRLTDIVKEGEDIDSILFLNNNSARRIVFKDVVIEDTSAPSGIVPKHIVQEARNAVLYIDGVKIEKPDNEIEDVIKGVNLKIKGKSEKEVLIDVDRDYEKITGGIVKFIENYNELLNYINEQTRVIPGGNIEETKTGVLTGDITIIGIKNKIKNIMMNPYTTDRGKTLSLLAQIGISMGSTGSKWSDIREGFLQVDEDKFINAIEKYPNEIKQLFGSDNNNDMVIDNGVAYIMDKTLKAYSDPRVGIITYHIKNTDAAINNQDRQIEDWKDHLEDYRKKLERDFTLMQQALHELEQNQKSIENFSKQFQK